MRRRRAILFTIAVVAVAAIGGLVVSVRLLADPARLKAEMQERVRAAWGRELTVADAEVDVFPLPALHLRDVVVSNPGWAHDRSFITAQGVDARLAILPLFAGKVRMKALAFEHGTLCLEKRADGTKTWGLVASASNPKHGNEDDALGDLVAVEAGDIAVTWRDGNAAAVPWRIESLDAHSGTGLRDARIAARLSRRGHAVAINASFDDLSRRGQRTSATEGEIHLDWGTTRLSLKGRIPLDGTLIGHALHADLESSRLNDLLSFFDIARRPTASADAHFDSSDTGDAVELKKIKLRLGTLQVEGDARVRRSGSDTLIDARLAGGRLDWVRALLDAGAEPIAPAEPPEMFLSTPFAWQVLDLPAHVKGALDARFDSVKLRNGVELRGLATKNTFEGDQWHVGSFSASMLGGTATGSLDLDGRRKSAHMRFKGTGLLLERWFRERGSSVPFRGGPMAVEADVTGAGESMRALAASLTGPVAIHLVSGAFESPKAGAAEAKLVGAKEQGQAAIELKCVSANLPFHSGRAERSPLIAAKSDLSYLVTSGFVDLRSETLELRGRVKPLHASVGMAAIAGDVVISGPIRMPHMAHDASKTPAAVARAGAAIATLGLSALATAHADASAAAQNDPCGAVL